MLYVKLVVTLCEYMFDDCAVTLAPPMYFSEALIALSEPATAPSIQKSVKLPAPDGMGVRTRAVHEVPPVPGHVKLPVMPLFLYSFLPSARNDTLHPLASVPRSNVSKSIL